MCCNIKKEVWVSVRKKLWEMPEWSLECRVNVVCTGKALEYQGYGSEEKF